MTEQDQYAVENGTRQTPEPFQRLSLSTENRSAREVARLLGEGYLVVDAPYQRGSVWTLEQRISLVRSWLQGIPVPAVMINDRTNHHWLEVNGRDHLNSGRAMYAAIDGRQRIETAAAWFNGEFAVPASWFLTEDLQSTVETPDGPYVTFDGLTKRGQTVMSMGGAMLPMTTAKVATLAQEADLYLLVNGGGTAQSEKDMANAARYAGAHAAATPDRA